MSDLTLILDRKDLVVRMDSKTIRVDRPVGPPERIPLGMLGRVVVMGNPMVSCSVWRALAEQNIPAVLIPLRGGGMPAFVGPGLSANVNVRVAQHLAAHDKEISLAIARCLLDKKIKGQEEVIKRLGNGKLDSETLRKKIRKHRMRLQEASDRNALMGLEGVAASAYFNFFAKTLPRKWKFSGRNRRPPRDPLNALLSLSYVMAGAEVRRVVQQKGLDPALGFLHSPQPGRESLVFDILEPLRPHLDWFVLQLLDKSLTLRDFTTSKQDGCLLNKKGRRVFFDHWALWQKSGMDKILGSMARDVVDEIIAFFTGSSDREMSLAEPLR